MTTDEKLAAILAAVQTDPGNRGLARDPHDNLFTATAGQFQAACRSIAEHPAPVVAMFTGFWISTATPPAFETDGPRGVSQLIHGLRTLGIAASFHAEPELVELYDSLNGFDPPRAPTHLVSCERPGPTADGTFRTMRGLDISAVHGAVHDEYVRLRERHRPVTIGIGDGGNEIGMGSIPPTTMANNIPSAAQVRCVVPCDHLIVAGVSNWGAYALSAGLFVARQQHPPAFLFDPVREHSALEIDVRLGPLVDGVTGRQEATVDGLPWDVYAAPLLRIREILELP